MATISSPPKKPALIQVDLLVSPELAYVLPPLSEVFLDVFALSDGDEDLSGFATEFQLQKFISGYSDAHLFVDWTPIARLPEEIRDQRVRDVPPVIGYRVR